MNTPQNQILSLLTRNDETTIPQVADRLGISIGTATKYVQALVGEGILEDLGKTDSVSGRRPHLYSLRAEAGSFLGLDISDRYVRVGLMDLRGEMVETWSQDDFSLSASGSFDRVCFILEKAMETAARLGRTVTNGCAVIPGRVGNRTEDSYSNLHSPGLTLAARLQEQVGLPFFLINDSQAMAYGEHLKGAGVGTRNMLLINVNWGLGMGIIIDGRIYRGKSGFAGELGHVYGFNNQIICRCGKRGCIETEVSGQALQRQLTQRIRSGETSILSQRVLASDQPLRLREIMEAVAHEDVLCIDCIEQIGLKLGEKISGVINVFNPELVVVGGELAMTGDYLLNPMRMTVNKHSIQLVSQDTRISQARLGMDAGLVGACLMARARHLGEPFEC